ncbi:MAG TPA: hypothetical protein VG779_03270 [Actinomycetota bacterium]|nr:hypothetical protein [Actinomycetota bacterium]
MTGALVLMAMAALSLAGCSKSHQKPAAQPTPTASASPTPSPSRPADVHADFHAEGVAAVDAQNRATSNNVANDAAKKVLDLIDAYYNSAFLEPGRWAGGSHPDLAGMFTDDAKSSVGPNLQVLALGSVAPLLTRVVPNQERAATIRVLIEPNQSASFAAVYTHFDGTGQPAAPGAQPVHIIHDFQILMDVGAGKIVGYEASTSEDSMTKSASYLPPASPALAALGSA